MPRPRAVVFYGLIIILLGWACSGPDSERPKAAAGYPIHLEAIRETAEIEGSEVPQTIKEAVEWRFNEPQPDWKPIVSFPKSLRPVKLIRKEDSIRFVLDESTKYSQYHWGGIWIELPDWQREDWAYIIVSARAKCEGGFIWITGKLNRREKPEPESRQRSAFMHSTEMAYLINDGAVHSYIVRADWSWGEYSGEEKWVGPWKQLGLEVVATQPATVDILSVSVIPKEVKYARTAAGLSTEVRQQAYRQTLFLHAPGKLTYQVRVPEAGRLDFAMGVLRDDAPMTFRISARAKEPIVLFEEVCGDNEHWAQRSLDLSSLARKTVRLALEVESKRTGAVALWAAPTITGARSTRRPNVIFYIIDGASAVHMSVYGYNRRTTPNLERLAVEGAVFENAYSNSSFTKVSVPSFMTSLHSSVLGPYKNESDPIPEQAVPMAQHMHSAGYLTAAFVSNPHCGTMSGLDRGVDVLREAGVRPNSISSEVLQQDFWKWREEYPREPYWAYLQPTDVHWPREPSAPFAGLYVDPGLHKDFREWWKKVTGIQGPYTIQERIEKAGVDRARYSYVDSGIYDEGLAHQDDQIGRLVERIKAAGEWEHTLFIVAADHSHEGVTLPLVDPIPPPWGSPILASHISRIPLIVTWPEKIRPGQRLNQAVSMIDLLPTILDLTGLPEPKNIQGQSLAPLLLGKSGWQPKPVIFDEFFRPSEEAEQHGKIEVLDGSWGASLKIGKGPWDEVVTDRRRPSPLLLYDIRNDPYCLHSLHKEQPELVEKYTRFLKDKWNEHQARAKEFSREDAGPLSPEQIETLRSLGYVR